MDYPALAGLLDFQLENGILHAYDVGMLRQCGVDFGGTLHSRAGGHVVEDHGLEVNPIPVKTALAMMGRCQEVFRSPMCEMEPENREKLEGVLREYGLLRQLVHFPGHHVGRHGDNPFAAEKHHGRGFVIVAGPDQLFSCAAEELEGEFAELIPSEDCAVFLSVAEDGPVGFAQCQLRRDYVEGTQSSPVGYLEGIFVLPAYRNRSSRPV